MCSRFSIQSYYYVFAILHSSVVNHVFVYTCLVFYYVTFIMLFMLSCQSYATNVIVLLPRCWFFCLFFDSINFSVHYYVMILYIRVSGQGPWNFPYLNHQIISFYKSIYSPFILLALFLYDNHSVAFHYFNYLWCHHLFTWLFIDGLLLLICLLLNSYFMGIRWITIHFYYCYYFYYRWQVVRKLIKESVTAFIEF